MPLLNAFVDSFVCVGFSSERGVTLDPESKNNGSFFTSSLQPSVLAIVTADRAMYPQSRGSDFIDPSYPTISRGNSHSLTTPPISSGRSSPVSIVTTFLRTQKQHIIPDKYNNLPLFCFPDAVQVTYQRENERIHHLVFTQEEGKRSYALALTFQQAFTLRTHKPDDDGTYQIDDANSSTGNARRATISKIPVAIEKQKIVPQPFPPPPPTPAKRSSKKMPSSFPYADAAPATKPRSATSTSISTSTSNDTTKQQHRYALPTFSSYMKNLSPGAAPPPTRMVRTNSQSNLSSSTEVSSSTPAVRVRSGSTVSRSLSVSSTPPAPPPDTNKPFYLPHCVVLISTQPYWTAMQETISLIYDDIVQSKVEPSSKEYKRLIQKYASLACNTPVPPIPWERFSLSFNLIYDQSVLTFDPPMYTGRAVLDLDLSVVLLTLNIGKLLEVLAAIFTQQPIIFFSSSYSKLVTTLECLLYLIYPLKWIDVYVPFVPDGLRDYYLEGPPGSYIMGANSRHEHIVEELDISFTCNLDNDKNIRVPKKIEFQRIPPTKLHRFIDSITKLLEEVKLTRSLQNVHTPVRMRIDQQREFERQHRIETNQKIIKIFLDLMVDLCGDALKPIYWKVNHQQASPTNTLTRTSNSDRKNSIQSQTASITTFSKEKYLLSKTEGVELEFYKAFVSSTAFQKLMGEEMASTSSTVFRQICQMHSQSNEDQLYYIHNISSEDSSNNRVDSTATLCDPMSSQMLLPLPEWSLDTSAHYLDSCIDVFTSELQSAQHERSPGAIAVYAYLCGCALLARGQYLDGLRTLYLIENPNLFPHDYIETTVVPLLADECLLELFIHEPFYTKAPEWKQIRPRSISGQMSIVDFENSGNSIDDATPVKSTTGVVSNNEWNVVENALTCQEFSEHVHRLSIVLDKETTETLFNALLHWTDNTITKTLKKDKTLTNNTTKTPETNKPLGRRWSSTTLKDTLIKLNEHQKGNQTTSTPPKPSIQTNLSLPAVLFESFLDIWQQTNAEKVRMIRCLPEDRRNQESILKISTSGIVSKADGPGQLILTQKRLYFLPEARSSTRLLTELMRIVFIEKYQHQTVFSSSKPSIKIYTSSTTSPYSSLPRDNNATIKSKSSSLEKDSKSALSLLFKNNHEQELWYTIITELWSGLTIAHEQCDTVILNKASRHIALMDALANISYYEEPKAINDKQLASSREKIKQRHNEACLEMALNDLSIFTRMRQSGSCKPLSVETRNVLTRRLAPSINETERHAVRCLVFSEHPDNGRSSLWCAYGSKLKVFNVSTWICDPSDISFPSPITCMCLDARSKLWIGCIEGQLFVVDTITRICGAQLATIDGEGGCQTIAFDGVRNCILTADRTGSVTLWNASNWERLDTINLCEIYETTHNDSQKIFKSEAVVTLRRRFEQPTAARNQNRNNSFYLGSNEALNQLDMPNIPAPSGPAQVIPSSTDKLERIQIYENLLFACYRDDYILILRISDANTYTYEHLISVKYKTGDSTPIDSFLVYNKQVWISTGCIIYIFNVTNTDSENPYNLLMKKPVDDDNLIVMLGFSGYIWAGSLAGNVYVYRMDNYELYKTFAGHHGSVCCLCSMLDIYVVSGSAETDTSIAIWEHIQRSNSAVMASTATQRSTTSSTSKNSKRTDTNGEMAKPIDIL